MKISQEKKNKILEQILMVLFSKFPQLLFTSQIASEMARDEEFIKKLLFDLKEKKLIIEIKKNPKGITYLRRSRWKMEDNIYQKYKNYQST
ncbi:MAG: hypothetical protein IIA85_00390 [Nanoarchaeota archaeon]|nr:hypothetical protein [Nanoarchaeota archaeon]